MNNSPYLVSSLNDMCYFRYFSYNYTVTLAVPTTNLRTPHFGRCSQVGNTESILFDPRIYLNAISIIFAFRTHQLSNFYHFFAKKFLKIFCFIGILSAHARGSIFAPAFYSSASAVTLGAGVDENNKHLFFFEKVFQKSDSKVFLSSINLLSNPEKYVKKFEWLVSP